MDASGFAVDTPPAGVPPVAQYAAAVQSARKSAAPVLITIGIIVLGVLGAAGFFAMQVFETVSDVTHEITDTVDDAIENSRTQPGQEIQNEVTPKSCVAEVTRYTNDVIENFTDGEETSRVFQEASLTLDQANLQALINVVSDIDVATAAAQGQVARAKKAAKPIIARECGVVKPPRTKSPSKKR